MRLRFVGVAPQYVEHMEPIRAGALAAGWELGEDPDVTLVASSRDLPAAPGAVYMEHGCGLQWHPPERLQLIAQAAYVLAPNVFIARRFRDIDIEAEVIGTPKLDALLERRYDGDGPIAVSFHWASAYRSSILRDYRPALRELARSHPVIGHGHPRVWPMLKLYWEDLGIEPVPTFAEVVDRASVYVCDHSSTLYEWTALGRPVALMDYPAQQSFPTVSSGLRYSLHAGIGPHVLPDTFVDGIENLRTDDTFIQARRLATEDLYPFLGTSVARTLEVLHYRFAYSGGPYVI